MRKNMKWLVAGSTVLGAAAMMTVGAGAETGVKPVAPLHVHAADSTGNVTSADQAAVVYVEATYTGSGAATVLTTTADTVAGVAVYDVSVTAPNGGTYLVKVQQSNDVILSASSTTPPVTTTSAPTPPVLIPVGNTPIVPGGADGIETEQSGTTGTEDSTGASTGDQGTNVSSEDGQGGFTPTSGTITVPSSSDGNGQSVTTSGQGGSSDSTGASSTSGDN